MIYKASLFRDSFYVFSMLFQLIVYFIVLISSCVPRALLCLLACHEETQAGNKKQDRIS